MKDFHEGRLVILDVCGPSAQRGEHGFPHSDWQRSRSSLNFDTVMKKTKGQQLQSKIARSWEIFRTLPPRLPPLKEGTSVPKAGRDKENEDKQNNAKSDCSLVVARGVLG